MHQERESDDHAIAIVGVACRLPGGIDGMDDLATALDQSRDLVGRVPSDRFDVERFVDESGLRAGKSYTAAGGFLNDVAGFDAAYFAISPKEATQADPQQRLLLELTAEALDDAGIDPATLAGSDTAVYMGISDASYGTMQLFTPRDVNAYTMSGAASSIAANRLSYTFDFRGPSMAVDTACSSSLVALDRACRTLRDGTSGVAVCGGANLLLSPYHFIGFSQAAMLSRRGRCSSFGALADGFVRAEGGAIVVLKPLRNAVADGDRVHGVILGSATNSDGRTMGLALPNAEAQEDLLRKVYADAGVHPDELVYFEAHGTGTAAGDPLEAAAIGRALGIRRTTGALPIGSVKSNVGHLEPASGMAGLCKALAVLNSGTIPPTLHADEPSPDIDFEGLGLRLNTRRTDLPPARRPVVGVNSFGFGGTNAHVVLAAPPNDPRPPIAPCPPELPVLVSARDEKALSQAVERIAHRLEHADPDEFYDIAYTSCRRRTRHEHRSVVLAPTAADAARAFSTLVSDTDPDVPSQPLPGAANAQTRPSHPGPHKGIAVHGRAVTGGRTVFVFSGNGSQWAGMAEDLMAHDAEFRSAVAQIDEELAPRLGWSVTRALETATPAWRLAATEIAQPLLFAVQVAVTATLRARGVRPAMVLGHSVGEVAAAHCAGILDLAQAARVIAERSKAQARTVGRGRMAAAGLSREEACKELAPYGGDLEIAGINSTRDVTLAGDPDALAELGDTLVARGVFFRELDLDYAFHSQAMDELREPLAAALSGLAPSAETVPFYSTVTGTAVPGTALDAQYWWHNVRKPVEFAAAVEQAAADGGDVFLEIGPHPVLRTYLRRIADERPRTAFLATLRRESDGPRDLTSAAAAVIASGADVDWQHYFPAPGRVTSLPAYPWQRTRHWAGGPKTWVRSSGNGQLVHPLLGERIPAPQPVWLTDVEPPVTPWLEDHKVAGSVVMPATGYIEMAMAAGRAAFGDAVEVENLDISAALVIPWDDASRISLQTCLDPDDGAVVIASAESRSTESRTHARARARLLVRPRPPAVDQHALSARCPHTIDPGRHYEDCATAGLLYGPAFQVLTGIRTGPGEVLARYHCPAPGEPYTVHPALLDGALQAGAPLLADLIAEGDAYLPAAIDAVRVWSTPETTGVVWVRERGRATNEVRWDITITDEDGTVAVQLDGCRMRRFTASRRSPITTHRTELRAAPRPHDQCLPSPLPAPAQVVAAAGAQIGLLRSAWQATGQEDAGALSKECLARRFGTALAHLLPDPQAPFGVSDLLTAGMHTRHARMFRLLTPLMEHTGVLRPEGVDRWHLTASQFPIDALARELLARFPASIVELALGLHQNADLENVLRGDTDPLVLLGSDGAGELLEQFYDTAPSCRLHNRMAQALVTQLATHWPADRPLRILEIGAGTGGASAALLPLLPADRTRYSFTDVSPLFFSRAQKRFAAYDFVDYRPLDLDGDVHAQGFAEHEFDLVVAVNSLHTAKDLSAALTSVKSLLAPGGHLLAVEAHDAELLAPYFATLDSFYGNTDTALRPHSLLLAHDRWPAVLEQNGYTDIAQTGDEPGTLTREQYSVLLARAPQHPCPPSTPLPDPPQGAAFVVATEDPQDPLAHASTEVLARGGAPVHQTAAALSESQWSDVLNKALATVPPPPAGTPMARTLGLVLLLSEHTSTEVHGTVSTAARHADTLRTIARACSNLPDDAHATLWLVTPPNGAVPAFDAPINPLTAPAWGVARCLANENPDVPNRRVILHRSGDMQTDALRLVQEILDPGAEDEIVLTPGGRFVPRELKRPTALPSVSSSPFSLRVRNPGLSYDLRWEETGPVEPGPGEVAVEVRAAALNYRDMMQITGMLPSQVVEGTAAECGLVGLECAGVITACGPGVTRFKLGDRVAGAAPGSLSSHTVTDARALWKLPDSVTFEAAASMPVALWTVHYSLMHLASLRAGETILVHGAAGGVGLAALQYAQAYGATVIATAGSDAKRAFLRGIGIEHVLDSRSLDFVAEVRDITDGRGVDIVLNSLAGEAIPRSLELLRSGGRFLELGKRDIFDNKPLLLRPFGNNIAFFGVDLTALLDDAPRSERLLSEVEELTREGVLQPLAHSVFPAARVADAFKLMQHSKHLGKVVVAFDPLDEQPRVEPQCHSPRLDPAATYLITGGTAGFGAATANWLADLGARHLALVSRRGADAPEAADVIARLAARGVRATAYAADAADLSAMRRLVQAIDTGGHLLRGAVHCAMHLDDAALLELDAERITAVMSPKMGGAVVLDTLTANRECDLFLLYSSAATALGNIRQSPYVAANLYLEALARRRRRDGLRGTAIAWGAIGDVGYVARNDLTEALSTLGNEPVSPREAFAAAERLLTADADVTGVARYDWERAALVFPQVAGKRLSGLVPPRSQYSGPSRKDLLAKMSHAEAMASHTETLTAMLAEVLHTEPAQMDPHRRLDEYGMDSLMATELLVGLHRRYDIEIPPMELLRSNGTISDIARIVHTRLGLGGAADGTVVSTDRDAAHVGASGAAAPAQNPGTGVPHQNLAPRTKEEQVTSLL